MINIKFKKPPVVQMFDKYIDREYYKISDGLFFKTETLVRMDRLEHELILEIDCHKIPDKIIFNGKECEITII